jgi:hypothetical protein
MKVPEIHAKVEARRIFVAMTRNLILLICVILEGCAVADFTPYSGAQQNWPVSSGTFVDNKYAVPVFYGAPNRPYVVLGYLNAETAPVRSRRGAVVAFMARRAQELGGNGLIVLGTNREYVGSASSGSAYGNVSGGGFSATGFGTTTPLFGGKGDAVVIRLR